MPTQSELDYPESRELEEIEAERESIQKQEYQQREIFAYGRYINCQILNWQDGPPPKFLVCHPLHPDYREEFLATVGMGTWMRIELRDALARMLP